MCLLYCSFLKHVSLSVSMFYFCFFFFGPVAINYSIDFVFFSACPLRPNASYYVFNMIALADEVNSSITQKKRTKTFPVKYVSSLCPVVLRRFERKMFSLVKNEQKLAASRAKGFGCGTHRDLLVLENSILERHFLTVKFNCWFQFLVKLFA